MPYRATFQNWKFGTKQQQLKLFKDNNILYLRVKNVIHLL